MKKIKLRLVRWIFWIVLAIAALIALMGSGVDRHRSVRRGLCVFPDLSPLPALRPPASLPELHHRLLPLLRGKSERPLTLPPRSSYFAPFRLYYASGAVLPVLPAIRAVCRQKVCFRRVAPFFARRDVVKSCQIFRKGPSYRPGFSFISD